MDPVDFRRTPRVLFCVSQGDGSRVAPVKTKHAVGGDNFRSIELPSMVLLANDEQWKIFPRVCRFSGD